MHSTKRRIKYYRLLWLRHDLPAGLAVFLVALPLCLGIALASGAPLYAGLLAGIVGGVVVSLISGSALGVSGPAAGLTTLVAATIASLGSYQVFLLAVVAAGLFQLALGIFRLGVVASYFPSAVIKGMLAAIGIMLISKQVPLALGYNAPDFWTSGLLQLFESSNIRGNLQQFNSNLSAGAVLVSILSLTLLVFMQMPAAKKLRIIPAPLLVVLLGIAFHVATRAWHLPIALQNTQLVQVPANMFADIAFPDLKQLFARWDIWQYGLVIGLLATLETLLCVEAVDKLDRHNRITPVNRELVAQGIGNITCGLLGAIPITAVVVRGAANVDAGGRTFMSAFTHGIFLLLSVLLIPFLLNMIPYASLSAILLVTGYNLTKPKLYKNMWSLGFKQFLPFMITILFILFTDLLIGVSIGLLISIYYIIQNNFKVEYQITKSRKHETDVYHIRLNSNVTFLNKVNLRKALDQIPEYSLLTIDGSNCHFIDYDILEIISEFHNKAQDRHIEVHLINIERVNVSAIH